MHTRENIRNAYALLLEALTYFEADGNHLVSENGLLFFENITSTMDILSLYIEAQKFPRIPDAIVSLFDGMEKIVIVAINDADNNTDCLSEECQQKLLEAKNEYSKFEMSFDPEKFASNLEHLTNAWNLAIGVIGNNSQSIVLVEDNSEIPTEYNLAQNFPNPFNPSTIISYQLPERGNVDISIYDILGNLITKLVDREMEAGYHNVSWNAKNLSNGVYFYTIRSRDFVSTKKLLLLK